MCLLLLYLSIWNTILAWMFRYTHTCIVSVIECTQSPHFNIYSYVHMRSVSVLFAVLLCCCVAVLVLVLSLCQLNSVQLGVYFTYYSTESKMCVLIACVSCSQSMYWCHMICCHCIGIPTTIRFYHIHCCAEHSWNTWKHDQTCVSFSVHFGKLFCVFSALSIVTFSLLPLVTFLWPCSYRVSISFQFGLTMLFISSTCKCKLRIKQKKREVRYIQVLNGWRFNDGRFRICQWQWYFAKDEQFFFILEVILYRLNFSICELL